MQKHQVRAVIHDFIKSKGLSPKDFDLAVQMMAGISGMECRMSAGLAKRHAVVSAYLAVMAPSLPAEAPPVRPELQPEPKKARRKRAPRVPRRRWNYKAYNSDALGLYVPDGVIVFTDAVRDEFYASWEWKRLRYDFLKDKARRCGCCGRSPDDGVAVNVDHIKPIRHHWRLRLDYNNLQILCSDCNMGKGSRDETDWRRTP